MYIEEYSTQYTVKNYAYSSDELVAQELLDTSYCFQRCCRPFPVVVRTYG